MLGFRAFKATNQLGEMGFSGFRGLGFMFAGPAPTTPACLCCGSTGDCWLVNCDVRTLGTPMMSF